MTAQPEIILHTCDLSAGDVQVLEHATMLAWKSGAKLVSVHVGDDASLSQQIPDANDVVRRWNPDAKIEHERIVRSCCDDIIEGILVAVRQTKPHLIVAATHSRPMWKRVLHTSIAEAVADETHIPTMFIPVGGCGALDELHGRFNTSRIVIAAEDTRAVNAAAPWASWLAAQAADRGEVVMLHAGGLKALDDVVIPEIPGWEWRFEEVTAASDVANTVAEYVQRPDTILVMPTHGHDSLLDAMFGSMTERVLHQIKRPLLAVPY